MTGTRHVKFTNLLIHLIYTITQHAIFGIGVTGWWLQPYPLEVEWGGVAAQQLFQRCWALLGLDCGSSALYTVLTINTDLIVTLIERCPGKSFKRRELQTDFTTVTFPRPTYVVGKNHQCEPSLAERTMVIPITYLKMKWCSHLPRVL